MTWRVFPILFAAVCLRLELSLPGTLIEPVGRASNARVRVGVVLVGKVGVCNPISLMTVAHSGPSLHFGMLDYLEVCSFHLSCQTWRKMVHKTLFCVGTISFYSFALLILGAF